MSKIKVRMTLDVVLDVDVLKCNFEYLNDDQIKKHLVSKFFKNCDMDKIRVDVLADESIKDLWDECEISKTIESYEIEFERELTPTEIQIITSSIKNNRFDHDEELRNIQN